MTAAIDEAVKHIDELLEKSAEYKSQYWNQRFGETDSRGRWKEQAEAARGKEAIRE